MCVRPNLLMVLILIAITTIRVNEGRKEQATNNIILEKVEPKLLNTSLMSYVKWEFRPIAPNVFRHNMTFVLPQPLHTGWIHFDLYYKYKTYNKFLIDFWENFCGFWDGKGGSPLSALAYENILRAGHKLNFKLQCPLSGTLMVINERLNMSEQVFPLVPAGRYRLDLTYALKKNEQAYLLAQFYFRISDLRVWF